jgi:DNA-nicking Smr family endonuclease
MPSRFRDDEEEDPAAIFAAAVSDVKPLPPHNLADVRSPSSALERTSLSRKDSETVQDEHGCIAKGGIQRSILRKVRNGQMPVEDELDLHGYTVQEAEEKLRIFLQRSRLDGQRVVRIIHGKGHGSPSRVPILRAAVHEWLWQSDDVLAFCPAGPTDGGAGAVRVLLKSRRK